MGWPSARPHSEGPMLLSRHAQLGKVLGMLRIRHVPDWLLAVILSDSLPTQPRHSQQRQLCLTATHPLPIFRRTMASLLQSWTLMPFGSLTSTVGPPTCHQASI